MSGCVDKTVYQYGSAKCSHSPVSKYILKLTHPKDYKRAQQAHHMGFAQAGRAYTNRVAHQAQHRNIKTMYTMILVPENIEGPSHV